MKKIEAIIQTDRMDAVANALKEAGVGGFTILQGKGRGSAERPTVRGGRGTTSYVAEYNTVNSIVTLVDDSKADAVVSAISEAGQTGKPGAGIIYVSNVEDIVSISSKKRGSEAL